MPVEARKFLILKKLLSFLTLSNIFAIDRFAVKMKTFLIILLVAAVFVASVFAADPGNCKRESFEDNLKKKRV